MTEKVVARLHESSLNAVENGHVDPNRWCVWLCHRFTVSTISKKKTAQMHRQHACAYMRAHGRCVHRVEAVWESHVSPQCELLSSHRLPLSAQCSTPLLAHSHTLTLHVHAQGRIRPQTMEIKHMS